MINLMSALEVNSNYLTVLQEMRKKHKKIDSSMTLNELKAEIANGYNWQPPNLVKIPKPDGIKTRDIFIFNDDNSLVQKVINKILTDNFGHLVSDSVFSYKKGVRTFNAAKHIQSYLKSEEYVGVKVDIHNYFMSVNKETIDSALNELIEDEDGLNLIKSLLSSNAYYYKNELQHEHLGIMPGCAISSFLANYLLRDVDAYLERMCIAYARYSDDLLLFCKNDNELEEVMKRLAILLSSKGLILNPNKISKVNSWDKIEFLGLEITKDYIDISKETFVKLKKTVKKICDISRQKQEKSKSNCSSFYLEQAIKKLNKVLYKSIIRTTMEHKAGRITYAFGNVTRVDTLLELDFYIKDSLRYVFTGRHNKANSRIMPTEKLEALGYVPIINLYNLYKMDKDIFYNEIDLLNVKKEILPRMYVDYNSKVDIDTNYEPMIFRGSFNNLFTTVLDYGYFIINGRPIYAEGLDIDLEKRTIKFGNTVFVEGNQIVIEEVHCKINNKFYRIMLEDCKVSDLEDRSPSILLNKYLQASYTADYSEKVRRVVSGATVHKLFRDYAINEIANNYDMKRLDINIPYLIRYTKFMCYLYCHIVSGILWEDIDYSKEFIKYKEGNVYIILRKNWFM